MTNVLFYGYYYRYRELRKQIKNLLDSDLYEEAKTNLDSTIIEHQGKYGQTPEQRLDFNYGERIILKHAKRHLDAQLERGNVEFINEQGEIIHQSDKVKHAISDIPKPDYHYHGSG